MFVKAFPVAPYNTSRIVQVPSEVRLGTLYVKHGSEFSDIESEMGFAPSTVGIWHVDERSDHVREELAENERLGATHYKVKFALWQGESCLEALVVDNPNTDLFVLADNGKTIDRVR